MEKTYTAKTVEEALALAKQDLQKEEIDFEVIAEPKKGLFGTKGEAVIKVTYEESKSDHAKAFVEKTLKLMGIEVEEVIANETADGVQIEIKVDKESEGEVIGRRGENLDALQYLTSLSVNRATTDYYRITLDCCGYREKRKETLRKLAFRMAKSAVRTGRAVTLEPMNPFERRIIHSAVAEFDGATSQSEGEEPYRKVVITPTGKRKSERQKDRRPRERKDVDFRSSFEKEYQRSSAPTEFDSADFEKPETPDDNVPLYGKIEF